MSKDKIMIDRLTVFASHGVYKEENVLGQKFEVSAGLSLDTRQAGRTDRLKDSVNYGEVCRFMADYLQKNTYSLLEAAAENLAEAMLMHFPLLDRVKLTIGKPWAPVKMPVENIAVSIERGWHTAYLSIGSNRGDRKETLDRALQALGDTKACRIVEVSDYLETEPYGGIDQENFLNGAVCLRTLLTPQELLARLHEIEKENGRNREKEIRWGPRTLDMDILLYDDLTVEDKDLCIPHVQMHRRFFVLKPLAQIAPYKRHPVYGKTIMEMLEDISGQN